MSTRRLPVITLYIYFECILYPVMFCLMCLWWPRRLVIHLRLPAYQDMTTFSKSFHYYPPPAAYLGYPTIVRFVRVVVFLIILLHLLYVLYVSLLPLFRWLPVRPSTVMTSLNPNPVLTTGESRMFLALGVQDRYSAVISASLHRLGFISWLRWLGS